MNVEPVPAASSIAVSSSTSGGRSPPADRDVGTFERALHGPDRTPSRADEDASRSQQDEEWDTLRLRARIDAAAMTPVSAGARADAPAAAETLAPMPLDDLIARYVQQLAVSQPGAAGDPRVMLKLDPALLPDTELFLVRTQDGWLLQANVRSPHAWRVLADYGPALERRFAQRRLGDLKLETTYQPETTPPAV